MSLGREELQELQNASEEELFRIKADKVNLVMEKQNLADALSGSGSESDRENESPEAKVKPRKPLPINPVYTSFKPPKAGKRKGQQTSYDAGPAHPQPSAPSPPSPGQMAKPFTHPRPRAARQLSQQLRLRNSRANSLRRGNIHDSHHQALPRRIKHHPLRDLRTLRGALERHSCSTKLGCRESLPA
ncbi:UNVERIFIED_CONTAM: hypothetical protein K2H54_054517 [Gekko kuhli]